MILAYIGLGSNLDDPEMQVRTALAELAELHNTRLLKHSSLYLTAPVGPQDQPDFINAVALLDTGLPAPALLAALQEIEEKHGRRRTRQWGPRTLDLDMLLYGNMQINENNLTVPHPHIASRGFVLYPLLEVEPLIEIPGLGAASNLLERLDAPRPPRI